MAKLDALAIDQAPRGGPDLMEQAGLKAWRVLRARWPEVERISVCCGAGNNGGDGWVIARCALEAGVSVQALSAVDPDQLQGDAKRAHQAFAKHPHAEPVELLAPNTALTGEVVVDALLGIGLRGPVTGRVADGIEAVVASALPVLAVDVPSGLVADTGAAPGPCVRAEVTVSFVGQKRGLFTGVAGQYRGRLVFDALGADALAAPGPTPDAVLLDARRCRRSLPPRLADTHKGQTGHVGVVGGAPGMAGAPVLSALGALFAGSGKVTVWGSGQSVAATLAQTPALMAHDIGMNNQWQVPDFNVDVLAIGPGLGRPDDPGLAALLAAATAFSGPLVVDADGLNALADRADVAREGDWVLTPHPGEAARLLGVDTASVQADRFEAARALAARYRAVVVLKGWGSLIASPNGAVWVCPQGTPAMASAGMGDVLTGVIASLWGQGMNAFDAARCAVFFHACAGELAAAGRRSITADQLAACLPEVMATRS